MSLQPANEDEFCAETVGDWFFSILVSIGAVSALLIALAVTL
jgi:hypothetical protein